MISTSPEGVRLRVYAQPGASKNQIAGPHGDSLKIKIHAIPEDGKANAELISFLAKQLGVAKSTLELVSGQTSRNKVILVRGLDQAAVAAALGL